MLHLSQLPGTAPIGAASTDVCCTVLKANMPSRHQAVLAQNDSDLASALLLPLICPECAVKSARAPQPPSHV